MSNVSQWRCIWPCSESTSVLQLQAQRLSAHFFDKIGLFLFLKNPRHGKGWCCMSIEWFGELDCCPDALSSFIEREGRRQDEICNALSQKYSFVEKLETRICKALCVSPSKQSDGRRWGSLPGSTQGSIAAQSANRRPSLEHTLVSSWCFKDHTFTLKGKIYYNQSLQSAPLKSKENWYAFLPFMTSWFSCFPWLLN